MNMSRNFILAAENFSLSDAIPARLRWMSSFSSRSKIALTMASSSGVISSAYLTGGGFFQFEWPTVERY